MKRNISLILLLTFLFSFNIWAEEILILPAKGVIDLGLSAFIKRGLQYAQQYDISTIILEIDTPGGRLDAADIICEQLLKFKGETISFIINWAWSAGSMIALATDRIIMAPGSSIGSAEPRAGLSNEELKDEKIVSALRARFRAIAEAKGHDPLLAEAMVDKDLEVKLVKINGREKILTSEQLKNLKNYEQIETISPKGKLLNLSYLEARKFGLANAICKDRETLLAYLNKENTKVVELSPTWSENLVRFITHPIVSSLLLGIGFWALIFALKIPGLGAPEFVGITALLLFFWGYKLAGLAQWVELLLVILGLILIFIEIFILPGFGITGSLGIICLFAGIVLSFIKYPLTLPWQELERVWIILLTAIVITSVFLFLSFKLLSPHRGRGGIILARSSNGKIKPQEDIKLGDVGIAISHLRPAGKAKFRTRIYNVQTSGEWVEKGKKVKIISLQGNTIKVRQI
jgi:membrane-bound serine protease (ClpP class)